MKKFSNLFKLAVTAFVAIGLVRLVRRWVSVPTRLFFYSPVVNDNKLPTGAVATLSSDFFAIEPSFSVFSDFSFVTSAANKKIKWLLFHKSDGSGCTAFIDRNFILNVKKYYPPGKLSNWPWWHVKVDGRGCLLLMGGSVNAADAGKINVGFAEVLDDGTYVEWWRTLLTMQLPDWVVGLPGAHALYVNDDIPGTGSTVYIFDVKTAQILSSRRWEEQWDGMACEGNVLFFYSRKNNSEMCMLTGNNEIVTMRKRDLDPDLLLALPFHYVTSTKGVHFCYSNLGAHQPRIRTLSKAGFPVTHKVSLDSLWYYIVPC